MKKKFSSILSIFILSIFFGCATETGKMWDDSRDRTDIHYVHGDGGQFQPLGHHNRLADRLDIGNRTRDGIINTPHIEAPATTSPGSATVSVTAEGKGGHEWTVGTLAIALAVFVVMWLYGRFDRLQDRLREAEIEAAEARAAVRAMDDRK